MTEIETSDGYFTSTVDDSNLSEIKKDLGETELIAYQHVPEEESVTVVIDISQIQTDLRYIY